MLIVEMKSILKRFGDLVANDHIDFALEAGEIQALLGENGAGKTTLMRILYGLYHADHGEILINDRPVTIRTPKDAIANGIGMVTQHFTLVPTLTVAENLALGEKGSVRLDIKEVENQVAEASKRFGIPVKPEALVRHLSVGERQRVEILKALYRNAQVLILDEPTAVLVPQEVDALFEALKRLQYNGLSVIFISHKLHEVMELCNRVTVLRDGKAVGTVNKEDTSTKQLAVMMVGRESFGVARQAKGIYGEVLVEIKDLCAVGKKGLPALRNINLEVRAGEILGIAGVSGNGQAELSAILCGMQQPASGQIIVEGRDLTGAQADVMSATGIGRIPEDRHTNLVGDLSVAENLVLDHLQDYVKNGVLERNRIQEHAGKLIEDFQIKATPRDSLRTLSGGNMQKVMLARTFYRNPRVVIVSQPTRGLDVGATDYVRSQLLEQRKRGTAVLLISEDLDEIIALSDRIAVIYEGEIMGIIAGSEATPEKLGLMMSGSRSEISKQEKKRVQI